MRIRVAIIGAGLMGADPLGVAEAPCAAIQHVHGEEWWRSFCYRLRMAGYDGWLSVEHEDVLLNS